MRYRKLWLHQYQLRQDRRKTSVAASEFVKVWMTSDTVADVAERLEMDIKQVSVRASGLRKRGVKLPKMTRRIDPNSTAELNKIVERYMK